MRKQRKKYKKPGQPWQSERISTEASLLKEYGLTNKKEVWKMSSLLRNWQRQARAIFALSEEKKERVTKELLSKLINLQVLKEDAQLDDVLALTIKELLDRRLQTIIYRMGIANTIKQSRQIIVHKKVSVNKKAVSSPSYLVKKTDSVDLIGGRPKKEVKQKIAAPKVEDDDGKK